MSDLPPMESFADFPLSESLELLSESLELLAVSLEVDFVAVVSPELLSFDLESDDLLEVFSVLLVESLIEFVTMFVIRDRVSIFTDS